MTHEEIASELWDYFRTILGFEVPTADTDYFEAGLVDSLHSLVLVTHLERRFSFDVDVDDLALDNFRTINLMAGFVRRKLAPVTARGGDG